MRAAQVLLDQVKPLDGYEQFVLARVPQLHVVALDVAHPQPQGGTSGEGGVGGHVDDEVFDGLHAHTVDLLGDDFGA